MKMRLRTQLSGMTLAVLLALTVGQVVVAGEAARAAGGGQLEGTWLMQGTLVNCVTGAPLPIPGNPFPAMHTYMRDGTMLDTGASPPRWETWWKAAAAGPLRRPPPPSTSTAHGIWERTGEQAFRERFRLFNFNAAGVHVSTTEVTVERSLIRGNNAATDEIIGVGTAKFFTPVGVLVREGCNEDSGRRFEFEE